MYIWIRFIDDQTDSGAKRKVLDDFQGSSEGDISDNEEDKFLPNHFMMIERNREKEAAETEATAYGPGGNTKRPFSNEEYQDTINKLNGQLLLKEVHKRQDTFRQRKLFIKKQPPLLTMICLMWNSPITKFWTFQVFYIIFLGKFLSSKFVDHFMLNYFSIVALFSLAVIWPGCGNWYLDISCCTWLCK